MITNTSIGHYGRLGNQMFQYSLLFSVSKKFGREIILPIENEHRIKGRFNPVLDKEDVYGLDLYKGFDIDARTASHSELLDLIEYKYNETYSGFCPDVFTTPDNTDFKGYFQYWKYFDDLFEEVKKEFTFLEQIESVSRERMDELSEGKKTIGIHVRRGDGLQDNDRFQILHPLDYYSKGIDIIKSTLEEEVKIIVFSDDTDWCNENIKFDNAVVADQWESEKGANLENEHIIDLCMMTMCDHLVMANSTYSWWGAFLMKNESGKVVVPNEWWGWGLKQNSEDFLRLPHWISI